MVLLWPCMVAQDSLEGDSRLKPKEVKKRVSCVGSVISQMRRSYATKFCRRGKGLMVRHVDGKWPTIMVKNEERGGCAKREK